MTIARDLITAHRLGDTAAVRTASCHPTRISAPKLDPDRRRLGDTASRSKTNPGRTTGQVSPVAEEKR